MRKLFNEFWRFALIAGILAISIIPDTSAQEIGTVRSAFLTIELDRFFSQSKFGLRIAREIDEAGELLAAENRQIEAELVLEEQGLTERRKSMEPIEFRQLADAFDEKVQEFRRVQDGKVRQLSQKRVNGQNILFQEARPVLEQLMRETGAVVILERSNVFLSANVIDITDVAITRIDAAIGDGSALEDGRE
ncbi:MAG: OmpH family outer membrane protein [Aestuariivita sp.]|nr:OmpH family outer membrane protein [Aestuariivita sp.]